MTVIADYMSIDERDDLDLELLAPGAWGIAGMHGIFAKPVCMGVLQNQGMELATDALTH